MPATTRIVELTEDQIDLLVWVTTEHAEELDDEVEVNVDRIGDCRQLVDHLKASEACDPFTRVLDAALQTNGFDATRAAELAAHPDLRAAAKACLRSSLPSTVA